MKQIIIDTNILISFLTDRNLQQQELAAELMQSAADLKIALLCHQHVVTELVYVIKQKIVDKERRRKYRVRRVDRFMYRTRYFTDAGIIGSRDFVSKVFDQVKSLLGSKDERKFTPVGGVEGGVFHEAAGHMREMLLCLWHQFKNE